MGNAPSESNMGDQLRCCKCYNVLPSCSSFSDFNRTTIHGRDVYAFNGNQYFRPVGYDNAYECHNCFYIPIREEERRREEAIREQERRRLKEEEERKREEERRREEERKREEERRREEERKREEERRREEEREKSLQKVLEQYEDRRNRHISEEQESRRRVLMSHLDEFESNYKSDDDKLLETLSSRYNIPFQDLSLSQLTPQQLVDILSALDKLLFDEWVSAPPSRSTLQHTQVFITELCALFLEKSHGLYTICNHLQSLGESISQSACKVDENFLLTQALYLNLVHFLTDHHGSCDSDAALIANQWAEGKLSKEELVLIEFLSILTSSLEKVVNKKTKPKVEIQCLELLLFKLPHPNVKEIHSESREMLLRLVKTHQWTPAEAVTLLKGLSEKYKEDAPITEVLMLAQLYNISPQWTDDSGQSVIQALASANLHDFTETLRTQDEKSLNLALEQLKTSRNLDDSVVNKIKNITAGVLEYSKSAPKDEPFKKDCFTGPTLGADNIQKIQNALSQLCKAVSDTKGWWPTVQQMLRWCLLALNDENMPRQLVGAEEDPCVRAMFAATQFCMGNKVDVVLSSYAHLHEQTKEWTGFYKQLGIPLKKTHSHTNRDVYEADIVYYDYFQLGFEGMETGSPHLNRRYIIEEKCLSIFHDLDLIGLKEDDALVVAAKILKSLLKSLFQCETMELRTCLIKALFEVLHSDLNKPTDTQKIITILQKYQGKNEPSLNETILTDLNNLLNP